MVASPGSAALIHRLRPHAVTLQYRAGSVIVEQGTENRYLFCLLDGVATSSVGNPAGAERMLALLEAGCLFGEMSALDGGLAQVTLRAITDVRLLAVDHDRLHDLLASDCALGRDLLLCATQKLRVATKLVADSSLRSVSERLACLLHHLARQKGPDYPGTSQVTLGFSHQLLANILGVSRVAISQELAELKERGWWRRGTGWCACCGPMG